MNNLLFVQRANFGSACLFSRLFCLTALSLLSSRDVVAAQFESGQFVTGRSNPLSRFYSFDAEVMPRVSARAASPKGVHGYGLVALDYPNGSPVVADVAIEQTEPKTNDTLSFKIGTMSEAYGTSYLPTYQWKKNGVDIAGETGATLDLSKAGNGDKGDKISVVVTATDGTDSVSSESEPVTILNSAPVVTDVSIHGAGTPDYPKTLNHIAGKSTVSDADGDIVTRSFKWRKNGELIPSTTSGTLQLAVPGNGDRGDVISFVVTASDGTDESTAESESVTVANSAPTSFYVSFPYDSSTIPYTNRVVTPVVGIHGSALEDDDRDVLTTSYVWKKNGVVLIGENGNSLDLSKPGNGDKGDKITLVVTRNDGHGGITSKEADMYVLDTPSVPESVTLSPVSPGSKDVLKASVVGTDGDNERPTYNFEWTQNGNSINNPLGYSANTLDLGKIFNDIRKGDVIKVAVRIPGTSRTLNASVIVGNSAPKLVPAAAFKGEENKAVTGKMSAQDVDGDSFTFSVQRSTSRGALEMKAEGSFSYIPALNWNGTDSFIAKVTDAEGAISTATYTITIASSNGVPVPVNDVVKGNEDVPIVMPAALLLKNDSNGEFKGEVDPLRIIKVETRTDFPGKLQLSVINQTITFTPRANWYGTTLFVYTVQDSKGAIDTAQVTLQIASVNDAPVALPGRMTVVSGTLGEVVLKGTDVEGDALSFLLSQRPSNGGAVVVRVGAEWVLRYQSKVGFMGTDTITFVARDGRVNSVPAPITITVKPNNAPQLLSLSPNRGSFAAGSTVVFEQRVRDADGPGHMDAVAFVPSASATALVPRGGAAIWFDAINNQFTMTKDDGKTTFPPVAVGRTLENAQMRVNLASYDVIRGNNGILTLRWRITFKAGYVGVKSLWARVEDQGGASAGFTNMGQITLGTSTRGTASVVESSAPSS